MPGGCMGCGSWDTEMTRWDDGHFRRECADCDYIGGPFVSEQIRGRGEPEEVQAGLGDFV